MCTIVEAAQAHGRLLGEILVEDGLITPDELEEALSAQAETGKRLGEVLIERELISGPELKTALLAQFGVEPESEVGFGTGLWNAIKRHQVKPRRDEETTADGNYVRLELTGEPPSPSSQGAELVVVGEDSHALSGGSAVDEPGDPSEASSALSDDEHVDDAEDEVAEHLESQTELTVVEERYSGAEEVSSQTAVPQAAEAGVASSVLRPDGDGALSLLFPAEARAASASCVETVEPVSLPEPRADYLVFAPGVIGYELSHGTGAPPQLGSVTELNGVEFQVVKVGCSPLPADGRRCVYLAA